MHFTIAVTAAAASVQQNNATDVMNIALQRTPAKIADMTTTTAIVHNSFFLPNRRLNLAKSYGRQDTTASGSIEIHDLP